MELIIFIGLQGAGKSTFYRTRFATTHVHISKDNLRNNKHPERRQRQLLQQALAQGQSVVVDNTNPTIADRESLIEIGHSLGATVTGYYFESNVSECLQRNSQRVGVARVPDIALYATIKKLKQPTYREGFDHLCYVRIVPSDGFEVSEWAPEDSHE